MSNMPTWEQRASQLANLVAIERDHARRVEVEMQRGLDNCVDRWERLITQRDALKTAVSQMAAGRDWEREHGDSRTAYYQGRCLALLKEQYALKAALQRAESRELTALGELDEAVAKVGE